MPRSYWLSVVAVVGLALAWPIEGNAVGHHGGRNAAATDSRNIPKGNLHPTIPAALQSDVKRIAGALEAINKKPESHDEKRNADAQEKVAWWTPGIVGIAFLEMLITAAGVLLVAFTLRHTKRAADAAEETIGKMVRIERPYLWAQNFEVGGVSDLLVAGGVSIAPIRTIKLWGEIRNAGSRLGIIDGFAAAETSSGLPIPEIAATESVEFAPYIIGPDSSRTWDFPLHTFMVENPRFDQIMQGQIGWYIYGHIRYRDAQNIIRRAGFAFEFFRGDLFEGGRLKLSPCGPAEYWYDHEYPDEALQT